MVFRSPLGRAVARGAGEPHGRGAVQHFALQMHGRCGTARADYDLAHLSAVCCVMRVPRQGMRDEMRG